jgi:trehalose/maltose hydrolase-like predicted phosphorylase
MPGAGPGEPGLVPAADWLQVDLRLPDGPVIQHPGDVTSHRITLDMKRGMLLSESRGLNTVGAATPQVSGRAETLRLVSLDDRGIGLQLVQFQIDAGDAEMTLEASFEGLDLGLVADRIGNDFGLWRTRGTGKRLAIATAATLHVNGRLLSPASRGDLTTSWTWTCGTEQIVRLERFVAVVRADAQDQEPGTQARANLAVALQLGWRGAIGRHEAAWAERWARGGVEVEGDAASLQALRFAVYHLSGAANPADERVSIGARGLTGADYRGHVFWDTEIYLLPFYTMTWPEAARSLLMYRFHTLDGARAKAAGMGCRGAFYAWESADSGAETTPEHVIGPDRRVIDILCGKQEQHIAADVAYAVWQYWQATGDAGFMCGAGAEIILETGRFWASRAVPEADGRRHIRGVIGPDEYHEHIDDNAFTNVMARWNIRRAVEVAALVSERWPARWTSLSASLGIDDAELALWPGAAESILDGFDPTTGLFEQCAGFNRLEEIDLSHYAGRSVPMDVILGRARIQKSQVIKQADVVALLGLLPDEFPGATAAANFDYYEPRCSHGSSLSRAMHGLVAARLGRTSQALTYFGETAAIDLGVTHVTSDGGVHIAALGGLWMTAVLGFGGLSLAADGLDIDPKLPSGWKSLAFKCQWHGRLLAIRVRPDTVDATLEAGAPMTLRIFGQPRALSAGQPLHVARAG